jgi:hypothetical protein
VPVCPDIPGIDPAKEPGKSRHFLEVVAMKERAEAEDVRSDVAGTLRDAKESLRDARERMEGAYARTADKASRFYDDALGFSRENPGTVALVALSTGIGIGMWLGSERSRPRFDRQRGVRALATAVAEAVREVFDARR